MVLKELGFSNANLDKAFPPRAGDSSLRPGSGGMRFVFFKCSLLKMVSAHFFRASYSATMRTDSGAHVAKVTWSPVVLR
jgi:hypothetical protein